MKKVLFMVLAVAMFACTPKESGYVIEGTVTGEGITDGKAYLVNFSRAEVLKDTADFVDGKFTFKGKVVTPEYYGITFDGIKGRIDVFVENAKITVEANTENFKKAVITGGETTQLLNLLNKAKEEIAGEYKFNELQAEFYKPETTDERKQEIVSKFNEGQAKVNALDSAFYANNPYSYHTVNQLIKTVEEVSLEEMEAKVAELKALPKFAGNRYLADIENAVNTLKSVQPGMQAPDFTLNDTEGNPVTLSDVYSKNKITMIDFWAGWCGPCRGFNPTLVGIYNKYNKDGFGIIGVSFDSDAELWHKAIAEDKLTWTQVSDLKGWDAAAGKLYYVRAIPANIFVDQEGKVIKRKVGRGEMDEFIKGYLGL